MQSVFDLIGIGFGPNNIALAVHHAENDVGGNILFLEATERTRWQPGMLLAVADIQHSPHRDFITPVNPRSRFTFLNYLKEHERLLTHLNVPAPFPLRKELALYVQWVASFFADRVLFGRRAVRIELDEQVEPLFVITTQNGEIYRARALSLGDGATPRVPAAFSPHLGPSVFHLTQYSQRTAGLIANGCRRFAVIGGSQSAAELAIDLHGRHGVDEIHAVTRGIGFRQKDLSPFTEHVFFPEFVSWFHRLDESDRRQLNGELSDAVFGRADKDALDQLYRLWYEDRLDETHRLQLHPFSEVYSVDANDDTSWRLALRGRYGHGTVGLDVDAVVLATGFRHLGCGFEDQRFPGLLRGIADRLAREASGCIAIASDYSAHVRVEREPGPALFLNGHGEPSHGLGDAGSFPLIAHRAATIVESLRRRQDNRDPSRTTTA